ncbi:MAG TPA: diguanylate cyclase [Solirubrobacteraceae bacterium]|nr:diguanylate cyclase [Solirubrobacteraceae bacterium]
MAQATEASPDAVITIDPRLVIMSFNHAAEELYDRRAEEVVGQPAAQAMLIDERLPRRLAFLRQVLSGEAVPAFEELLPTASGRQVQLSISGTPVFDRDGSVVGMFTSARDISPITVARADLAKQRRLLEASQSVAHVGSWELNLETGHFEFSTEQYRLFGMSPDEGVPTIERVLEVIHPDDRERVRGLLQQRSNFVDEYRVVLPSEVRVMWSRGIYEPEMEGLPARWLGISQDITGWRRHEDQLRHLADHDPLTGLFNRRAFDQRLLEHMSECERNGAVGAVLMVDLDNFKHHNDTRGHLSGDELLVSIAEALTACVGDQGIVGRLGGDEFAVLLREARLADAEAAASAIVATIAGVVSRVGSDPYKPVTASVGIASLDDDEPLSVHGLMVNADRALYRAKARGRNQYAVYAADR